MKNPFPQVDRVRAIISGNRELCRIEISFALFNGAEWAVWIAMLVYAYGKGGATAAGIVAVVQLVPAMLFAPFASVLGDRYRPARVLMYGYVFQAVGMGVTAAVLLLGGPTPLVYACAAVVATAVTVTRPTFAALTPSLCHRPEELTAANVVAVWSESISLLVAPVIAGVLLAVAGPGWVFLVMGSAVAVGALLASGIEGAPANPVPGIPIRAQMTEGFSAVLHEPAARTLVGLLGAEQIAIGMLDVLYVVLAIGALGMGDGGAGYLNAAFGLGGALGIAVTASLVGRARLMPAIAVSLAVWTASFLIMTVWTTIASAIFLLALAGTAHALFNVAGKTLLQRTAPPEALARVFGVVETLIMAGLLIGSVLAPVLVHIGGVKAIILGTGIIFPLLAMAGGRRLLTLDATAQVPIVEIDLLRSLDLFSMLPMPSIEGIACSLERLDAAAGMAIVTQGEEGDRYYAIAEGDLDVHVDGVRVNTLSRGDGFGEIALLHDCTRAATVIALNDVTLYSLRKEAFLEVLTGHPAAMEAATEVAADYLAK